MVKALVVGFYLPPKHHRWCGRDRKMWGFGEFGNVESEKPD